MRDYYDLLGVPPDASIEEIKKVYRALAKVYHPDSGTLKGEDAHKRMVLINEAFAVLSDPKSREKYDLSRKHPSDTSAPSAPPPSPPQPIVTPPHLDFGTLFTEQEAVLSFTVDNQGGPASEINFSLSAEDSWYTISNIREAANGATYPLEVEVTVEVTVLAAGQSYSEWIDVSLDGVKARLTLVVDVAGPKADAAKPVVGNNRTAYRLIVALVVVVTIIGVGVTWPFIQQVIPANLPTLSGGGMEDSSAIADSEKHGQVVYTVTSNGQSTIHLFDLGNSKNQSLNVDGYAPSWSPDGSRIAFISKKTGASQVYISDKSGGDLIQITELAGEKSGLSWSPSGSKLAFLNRQDQTGDLYIVDMQAVPFQSSVYRLAGLASEVVWSPNGKILLISVEESGLRRIRKATIPDGQMSILADFDSWNPAWSPDGQYVAMASSSGVYVMNAEGKEQRRLTTTQTWQPSWSSDGRFIAYLSDNGNEQPRPELWLMDSNGRNQRRLTASGCWGYAWSSTGYSLTLTSGDIASQPPELQAWWYDIETGQKEYIFDLNEPSISWLH